MAHLLSWLYVLFAIITGFCERILNQRTAFIEVNWNLIKIKVQLILGIRDLTIAISEDELFALFFENSQDLLWQVFMSDLFIQL